MYNIKISLIDYWVEEFENEIKIFYLLNIDGIQILKEMIYSQ